MWLAPKQDSKPLTEVTVYLNVGESVEGWTISWPNRTYTPPPNISVACAYDGVECGYLDVDPADYAVVVDCLARPKFVRGSHGLAASNLSRHHVSPASRRDGVRVPPGWPDPGTSSHCRGDSVIRFSYGSGQGVRRLSQAHVRTLRSGDRVRT